MIGSTILLEAGRYTRRQRLLLAAACSVQQTFLGQVFKTGFSVHTNFPEHCDEGNIACQELRASNHQVTAHGDVKANEQCLQPDDEVLAVRCVVRQLSRCLVVGHDFQTEFPEFERPQVKVRYHWE